MYVSRLTAIYEPEAGAPVTLALYNVDALTEEPEFGWDLPIDSRNYIGTDYGEDVPTGNARYRMTLRVLREYLTVAQLEANMLTAEQSVALCRSGHLRLYRAYHEGVPTHRQRWRAVLTAVSSRLLYDETEAWGEAYSQDTLRGMANGEVQYEFTLTEPENIND